MTTHPEIGVEQEYVDRAYALLDKGLGDAERSMAEFTALHRSTAQAMQRALRILRESRGTGQLVFGKMVADGETLYVGRRRVRDEAYEPVVVSWHAPAAQRFYEASPADPLGVDLKRVFSEEERRLVRVLDEIVAAAAADATTVEGLGTSFSDALLLELDRARDGAMRDVVATIQAEQFAVIRAPFDRVVVVEGGPGTGKSVVGLHRAAWLAFNHESLRRDGVLVVAPSTAFLTYVSGVLPSLDVTDVDQVELQRLYAGEADLRGIDDPETARVKGSSAMADFLAVGLAQRIGWGHDDLVLSLGADRVRVPARMVQAAIEEARGRDLSYLDGREVLRSLLARRATEVHRADQEAAGRPARANEATIRRLAAFTNAVDRMWPSFTPEDFLRSLYSTQSWLVAAAEGLLTPAERARLYRPAASAIAEEAWTEADLFCLDEIAYLLTRDVVTYGHLVVDEAQDLSPLQARALRRRCPSGSMTILGDLAQATGVWLREDWHELTEHLSDAPSVVQSLSIGYRVPAPVLELAAAQLPLAGGRLHAPRSIREGAGAPVIEHHLAADLAAAVTATCAASIDAGRSVGVIVSDRDFDDWAQSLAANAEGLVIGDGRDGDFSAPVTLVPRSGAKGLEFDTVILVEPAQLAEESLHPPRSLYVAMTRCTQALVVLHSAELPPGFSQQVDVLETTGEPHLAASPDSEAGTGSRDTDLGAGPYDPSTDLSDLIKRLSPADRALVRQLVLRLANDNDDESST